MEFVPEYRRTLTERVAQSLASGRLLLYTTPPGVPGDVAAFCEFENPAGGFVLVSDGETIWEEWSAFLADGVAYIHGEVLWAELEGFGGGKIATLTAGGPGSGAEVEVTPAVLAPGGEVRLLSMRI